MLDIICIANLGTYTLKKTVCIGAHASPDVKRIFKDYNVDVGIETCFLE